MLAALAMLSLSSWDSLGDPALCPFMQRKLQAGEPVDAVCGAVNRSSLAASPDPGQTTFQGCNCSSSCAPLTLQPRGCRARIELCAALTADP